MADRSGDERSEPFKITSEGVQLAVRLTPRASRNGVDGVFMGADGRPVLQLRVTAPPVEGAANAALIAFVAEALGIRKADVRIVAGSVARRKRLDIAGEPAATVAALMQWIARSRQAAA